MEPQWNFFQSPVSEPSLLDYNRPYNALQTSSFSNNQSSSLYNGFYNQTPNSNMNYSKPVPNAPPQSPYGSSSSTPYYNSSGMPPQSSSYSGSSSHSHDMSQSNYYSSNNLRSNSSHVEPISDFKIGTFTLNSNGHASESNAHDSHFGGSAYSDQDSNSSANQDTRETGIIEKLLFEGNTEHLRIGDPVEFEVTFDRRTGKPIASSVTKISPEVVLSEERVVGVVTTELKSEGSGSGEQGRISYENRGECFFLPYVKEDVEGYVTLKPGDKVSFQIATNQRSGILGARHVRLENPAMPVKYQGVVSAIKDSYGFLERADVVDEIFFYFSESKDIPGGLKLGDDVEFLIETRSGKEVATNMVKLPPGTVVFEDTDLEEIRGQVLKPVEKCLGETQKDPLTGRIRYRGKDRSEVEVKFGERDQTGDFTLRHGDWVKFNIATDRRDNLQKATHISLLDESFNVSGEKREQGIINSLKDGFGFIKCADRDAQMFFQYTEILDPQREISVNEEVEFTVITDQTAQSPNRLCAIRIRRLAAGSVKFQILVQEGVQGEVSYEPESCPSKRSSVSNGDSFTRPGLITFGHDSLKQSIQFYSEEGKTPFQLGDRVTFNIYVMKRTKERIAMDVKLLPALTSINPSSMSTGRQCLVGSGRTFDRGSSSHVTVSGPPPNSNPMMNILPVSNFNQENVCGPTSNFPDTPISFPPPMDSGSLNSEEPMIPKYGVAESFSSSSLDSDLSNFSQPAVKIESEELVEPKSFSSKNGGPTKSGKLLSIHHGYIATLKESFGFIETQNHDKEIFFHFSNFEGNTADLELGDEVEYNISVRTGPGGKLSAENVRVLPVGSIPPPKILGQVYEGTVLRSMRSVNPDQPEYCGLVCVGKEEEKLGKHQFGIVGLVNKKELLQPSDQVTFQLDEDGWAVNIRSVRRKLLATVETVKGQYGFLNYGADEGKKLFFHQSEVKDGITLSPGDEVEFVIITNLKTGKSSACNVSRIMAGNGRSQRPDRLVSKLKTLSMDTSKPRVLVLRQPKGPDGTTGFRFTRMEL